MEISFEEIQLNHMSLSKSYFKNEAIWTLIFSFGPLVGVLVLGLLVVLVLRLLR